ncbi:MAG: peptide ABC transporter substrate-binding protein [Acidimicrobiaceae bacterium]|nr:peptide ABC transporter substrate-binding protein [Acidimicrobiaceae bacterium]
MSDASHEQIAQAETLKNAKTLVVNDLVKHFPAGRSGFGVKANKQWVKAVDGVSFDIAPGETLGLVGESGCGKSTIAKLILRLEDPTSGSIKFEGREITDLKGDQLKDYRRSVQAVFQDPYSSLSPRMRVHDIVAEGLRIHTDYSKSDVRTRVNDVLALAGLSPDVGRLYPHEFSGGQRQRIAIAKALVLDTKMLILDEAVSALDVSIRAQIITLLKDLQQDLGIAYLYIGHDLATVGHLSDRVMVMYLGRVLELDDSIELVRNPKHPYTEALFAAALPSNPDHIGDTSEQPNAEVPTALAPPTGCHFHPRCQQSMEHCSTHFPQEVKLTGGRRISCHLYPGD